MAEKSTRLASLLKENREHKLKVTRALWEFLLRLYARCSPSVIVMWAHLDHACDRAQMRKMESDFAKQAIVLQRRNAEKVHRRNHGVYLGTDEFGGIGFCSDRSLPPNLTPNLLSQAMLQQRLRVIETRANDARSAAPFFMISSSPRASCFHTATLSFRYTASAVVALHNGPWTTMEITSNGEQD